MHHLVFVALTFGFFALMLIFILACAKVSPAPVAALYERRRSHDFAFCSRDQHDQKDERDFCNRF